MTDYDFYDTEIFSKSNLKEDAELELHVRDRGTMELKAVRAHVSKFPDKFQGAGRLYMYGRLGVPLSDVWYIQIIKDLEESVLSEMPGCIEGLAEEKISDESFKKPRRIIKKDE